MNFAAGSQDTDALDAFMDASGISAPLHLVRQVHSARVVHADLTTSVSDEEADGVWTRFGSVGVRVADCAAVLLGDEATGVAIAVHAGWRGVVAGVVREGIEAAGVSASSLVAAIGPCIGPCCFEVGLDVAEAIADSSRCGVVVRKDKGRAWVDLRLAVRTQLEALGVARVDEVGGCTRCDAARFHSFRRDGARAGRMLCAISSRAMVQTRVP